MTVDDIDMYLTTAAASTVKTAGGADSITGANAVAHTVYSYGGNDTIVLAGDADDTVWTGLGNDEVNFGATAGTDTLILANGQGKTKSTNLTVTGDGAADIIKLSLDGTSASTTTGIIATGATIGAYTGADAGAYDWTGIDTDAVDFVEVVVASTPNTANGTLLEDYTNNNAEQLFIAMATSGANNNVGSLTVDAAGDKFYIVAYDDTTDSGAQGMYIYHANSEAVVNDASITVNEVTFVGYIDGVADDAVEHDDADDLVMLDLTTIDSSY